MIPVSCPLLLRMMFVFWVGLYLCVRAYRVHRQDAHFEDCETIASSPAGSTQVGVPGAAPGHVQKVASLFSFPVTWRGW